MKNYTGIVLCVVEFVGSSEESAVMAIGKSSCVLEKVLEKA